MVNIRQLVFSVLGWQLPLQVVDRPAQSHDTKSIAIIGAGSAGLAALKTLLDLPESTRSTLNIVLFEQRRDLGGVWLPDPNPPLPPDIPETPLYPLLHTNTPVPSMSYPGFPFPKGTALYPTHHHLQAYHAQYAAHFHLTSHIRFNHTILKVAWVGNPQTGHWDIDYHDSSRNVAQQQRFDHVIVATGNNHLPRIPSWAGQEEWLKNSPKDGPKRELLHSVWYRGPERYTGLNVLVVGIGSSGRDIAAQTVPYANATYVSLRHDPNPFIGPVPEGAHRKPDISHFSAEGVVLRDGTTLNVDVVYLATGYEIRKPFLDAGGVLVTDRSSSPPEPGRLTTNTRYITPLHRHIFSLAPTYPTNALAFIGLPSSIPNCPSDIAQSIFAVHAILDGGLLPPRVELLAELKAREEALVKAGYDPQTQGHRLLVNTSSDYQDELVAFVKQKGAVPDDGKNFVEEWRRDIYNYPYLRQGWKRIESLGTEREWLEGVETEEQWSRLMQRVNAWQEEWETRNDIPFRPDWDLIG